MCYLKQEDILLQSGNTLPSLLIRVTILRRDRSPLKGLAEITVLPAQPHGLRSATVTSNCTRAVTILPTLSIVIVATLMNPSIVDLYYIVRQSPDTGIWTTGRCNAIPAICL
jgi:hypothetical protein